MGLLVSTTFATYTPTASSELVDHPVVNVTDAAHPARTWRTTNVTADGWIRAQLTTQPLDGVFLDRVNVTQVRLESSSNGTTFTSLGTFATPLDTRINRRKAYLRISGFNHPYLRVVFPLANYDAASPEGLTGGPGGFQCGTLALVPAVTDLNAFTPVWPRDYVRRQATETIGLLSGGIEIATLGPSYLELALRLEGFRSDGITEAMSLSAITFEDLILIAENLGAPEHAYLCRRASDDTVEETEGLIVRDQWLLREVA